MVSGHSCEINPRCYLVIEYFVSSIYTVQLNECDELEYESANYLSAVN